MENYFEVLKLDIKEDLKNLKNQSEAEFNEFKKDVNNQFVAQFKRAQAMIHNPRFTEQDIADLKDLLGEAKNTLIDRDKRDQHIDDLLKPIPTPDPRIDPPPRQQSSRTIVKFRNGDEATSIPQLATLMEKNASEATEILYQGDLATGLAGAGETPSASAARAVVSRFTGDRQTGLRAMVAILRGTVKMRSGKAAHTPKQLASLIDQNWEEAKTLLYNGFIALWLEYTNETQLAGTAKKIVSQYDNQQDIGLEELIQRLDPQVGKPEPEVSQSEIDFGNMNSESQKTIQFKIKNVGRGFLYGDVQLASNMPGLQISNTEIQGDGVVTIKLDARALTAKQKHQASLVVDTNGGTVKVPVSCYITYPVQNSIQRLAVRGFSMAAIAIVARLIVQEFGTSGWLTGFIDWEQHWQWVVWFEWPWFEWEVKTLASLGAGAEFIIGFVALGVGAFAYWHFFFRKKSTR